MTHFMSLQEGPFLMIKSGRKNIEMRLFDEKRQKIKEGDIIEFSCGDEKISVKVLNLFTFPSFKELYENFSLSDLGYKENEFASASFKDMEIYYPKEKQKKYGVLALKIKLL